MKYQFVGEKSEDRLFSPCGTSLLDVRRRVAGLLVNVNVVFDDCSFGLFDSRGRPASGVLFCHGEGSIRFMS